MTSEHSARRVSSTTIDNLKKRQRSGLLCAGVVNSGGQRGCQSQRVAAPAISEPYHCQENTSSFCTRSCLFYMFCLYSRQTFSGKSVFYREGSRLMFLIQVHNIQRQADYFLSAFWSFTLRPRILNKHAAIKRNPAFRGWATR